MILPVLEILSRQQLPSDCGMRMMKIVDKGTNTSKNYREIKAWSRRNAASLYAYTPMGQIVMVPNERGTSWQSHDPYTIRHFAFADEMDLTAAILAHGMDQDVFSRCPMWPSKLEFTVIVRGVEND